MGELYLRYWGKADPTVPGGYHLAAYHCLDVAAVAAVWLRRNAVLRGKFCGWMSLDDAQVVPTVAAFVALHDFGKFDARFQMKVASVAIDLDSSRKVLPRVSYDHGLGGYDELHAHLADVVVATLGADAMPLLQAVCGHHGALPTNDQPGWDARYQACRAPDRAARAEWLSAVIACFGRHGAVLPWLGRASAALVECLAGLCSVADWVGSQPEYFPYNTSPGALEPWYAGALPKAERALEAVGFLAADASGRAFAELFPGRTPRDVQRVTEALTLPEGPCLVVVEAQMGSGKTEAALSLAERMLTRGDATGLFVALPTMATSNGMFRRLEDAGKRMFSGRLNARLAHSRSGSDDAFRRLIARALVGPSHANVPAEREATLVCARWFLGRKRALLGQLGVGTVDQALQAAIKVRHHFVRAFGLATSVVVIDEVHAYDVYMEVILARLVEWLGALRAPVILLSATLPAERRAELTAAYRRGAGFPPAERGNIAPADMPYPLVSLASAAGTTVHAMNVPPPSRTVAVEYIATDNPCADVLPRLVEAVRGGAMVAWIRNTVTDAQDAYEQAQKLHAGVDLFHARMRARDRAAVEQRVLERFGPTGERKGLLLIATQVIEQSLDLDFDLLATDLAPVDLVLQRTGRMHRHARPRPSGFNAPRALLVGPTDAAVQALRFGGSGYVYDPVTLWLAHDTLARVTRLEVPEQIRALVEASYDPKTRAARIDGAPNAGMLRKAEDKLRADQAKREHAARTCCIPSARVDPSALACRDDDDESVRALTRDGDSVTLLPVWWQDPDGGALYDGEAWRLDPAAPDAWRLARELHDEALAVPAYPWERIEAGARAHGEGKSWPGWLRRFEAFAEETNLGRVVVVPMRKSGEVFRGRVQTTRGRQRRIAYTQERGLWFLPEEGG